MPASCSSTLHLVRGFFPDIASSAARAASLNKALYQRLGYVGCIGRVRTTGRLLEPFDVVMMGGGSLCSLL